ncbi:phage DNA methylase [Mycobacteroides abscessus subsp. abscessus]|nr:DNA (cytosine-5-)-methyltransferase [Mycobacteroides abscessus]SII92595.1 phage DNA methylase [Mycobacteroides abscessus subsp. abscessus]SIJ02591.1 phage DNA methylase [Mycobacteroides abscessus subsp. abscessus]SIK07792.1 phage DNA methylase [Mycobacteroides abscessus subsp. abscessus]SIK12562.1 phage DNA methylase [Mycobacteroides abscessus subsp. abscessus]SIM13033.1 phage DNA methylase [Mycobacteroides abscessus subsp. abscessus]
MTPRIGSLFSGAGGLDLAVEHVTGGRTVWHCEADPDASKVLAAHWPDVPNLGDITAVDWSAVEPVDVLCGGFPCQDVSAAGRRAGIATGTRSGLWLEYAEAINQLRPQLVVIENVRGLLSGYAHRAMEPGPDDLGDRSSRPLLRAAGAVLGDLADLGYDAQWTTVAASAIGAPHRRERVFIVAYPAGKPWSLDQRDPRRAAADSEGDRRDEGRPEPTGLLGRSDAALGGNEADRLELLPTPTASRYGSNQSPSTSERPNADGVQHPTVKPLDLMRWLVRLVTPVGAVVLEPFAGSGTTAEACVLEDRQCIAIEREADYLPLIVSRLQKPVQAGLFGLEAGA